MDLTIDEIARLAGVGKATVSRVINNSGYVKQTTREKVERVMRENAYMPSAVARSLVRSQSDIVALIIPQIENDFYAEIIKGISSVLDENDYILMICNTDDHEKKDLRAIKMMGRQRVAGLIYTPSASILQWRKDKLKELLSWIKVPFVLFDRPIQIDDFSNKCDMVLSNNFENAYTATSALIKAGHKKIAAIAPSQGQYITRERINGFKKALVDNGLKVPERYIVHCESSTVGQAYQKAKELLLHSDRPTAIFCENNICSNGFLKAVFELRLKIPENIAYIGYDALPSLESLGFAYSCLDRDLIGMGRETANLLLKRIASPDKECENLFMPAILRLRGSETYSNK